jgi:peptidoglycan/LPS O-acetylase OafA/YrhL
MKIPSLNGLRALSFLFVFTAHAGLDKWVPGGFGVTVFFFLSGFLITTLMRVEARDTGRIDLKAFWLRRLLRIWPPFYIVLLAVIGAALLFNQPMSWPQAYARLLHFTNYWTIYHGIDGEPDGTSVYWSLAVEEHFYLIFPFLYLAILKLKPVRQAAILYALCALVLAWRIVLVTHGSSMERTYMATDTRVDSILYGCALAVWGNPMIDRRRSDDTLKLNLAAAIAVLLGCLVVRNPMFRETLRYSLQGLALTVVFTWAVQVAPRFLNWKPLMSLGTLSYSLYLMHFTIIDFVHRNWHTNAVLQAIVALAICIGLAAVLYVVVEKPCARLRRNLHATSNKSQQSPLYSSRYIAP